jgi:pyruvate formate lyase activating enzyme
VCKAPLQPVLTAAELSHRLGIHVELTYLIIPGKNDSEKEMLNFAEWVADLDPKIPVHFTRFHPDYKMTDVPPTPIKTMELAKRLGKQAGLQFIYLGNVSIPHGEDTICPKCGALVIERAGFGIIRNEARDGRCKVCGEPLNMVQSREVPPQAEPRHEER